MNHILNSCEYRISQSCEDIIISIFMFSLLIPSFCSSGGGLQSLFSQDIKFF